ncbi:pullulanase [Paenibacillus sp. B01]|nr:pullulanase [Paenibacillus sp. B01]
MNMIMSATTKRFASITAIFALLLSLFAGALPVQANADAAAGENAAVQAETAPPVADGHLRVHYQRTDGNYEGWGLWQFEDVAQPSSNWPNGGTPFPAGQADGYGAYVDIPLKADAKNVGLVVMKPANGDKDAGDKKFSLASPAMNEVWLKQGSDAVHSFEPVELPADTVRVHYQRSDGEHAKYGVWSWGEVAAPPSTWPTDAAMFSGEDAYGGFVDLKLKENAQEIGFLLLDPSKGDAGKDGGDKKFAYVSSYKHLFVKQGDDKVYISPFGELPVNEGAPALLSAQLLAGGRIHADFTLTTGLDTAALKEALQLKDKSGAQLSIASVEIDSATSIRIQADFSDAQAPLQLTYEGKTVAAAAGWRMMDELYAYDGSDLGATYAAGGATLKLWAPKASSVTVNVYDKDDATVKVGSLPLDQGERGVWSIQLQPNDLGVTDFKNYFYQYEVTNGGVTKRVLDPYAKSMAEFHVNTKGETGADGDAVGKAAIVDLAGTDPEGYGFADIDGYEKREDAVIWEIHVRDFTSDPSVESDLHEATWGTFDAFKQKVDYIKSLGVTHVQLLPVMAWYYGDEAAMKERELAYSAMNNEYNWGYDPHSYFSPDGAYSENPADPELRVRELKAMIDAIHDAGMGVILDVVYTHMAKADFLNDIVPNYYAFQGPNGNFLGGFGNNLATNRKMAEKLMVDSVKYWFDEYKIDGMRFDMMGDATYESIQNAYDAAAAINPQALFIGEGWRTFAGHQADPYLAGHGADQDWMDKTDDVGVFSDEFRNELKSGFGSEGEPRFITGGARDISVIFNNIKAQAGNTKQDDPGDMVQYVEAHDNLPLYDIVAQAIKKDPSVPENNEEILKRVRLGNLLTLTSQGTAFLHAGQEYGRTKQWLGEGVPEQKYHELKDEKGVTFGYFVHDSYDSSDAINKFDWAKTTDANVYGENVKTVEYTKGLIDLRKSSDAFRLGDKALVDRNVTLLQVPEVNAQDLVIAYKSQSSDGKDDFYVFVNADSKSRKLTLSEDLTGGLVVADDDEALAAGVSAPSGFSLESGSITLQPLTAVIIRTEGKTAPPTEKRYVQVNYIRPDKGYKDWNMWVWNTGVKNDQIDFQTFDNGIASVLIEVAPQATSVGFVLRRGTDWNTAKQDIPDDRIIPLVPGEAFTKVNVTSMVRELDIKPSLTGPTLDDGTITFRYRDDALFRTNRMNEIEGVKLLIGGQEHAMAYVPEQELFRYVLSGIEPGTHEYSFAVTKNGQTAEITDPKNTVDGKSTVTYVRPDVAISASASPAAIAAGQHAVLEVEAEASEEVAFKEAYLDLTALGGPAKVKLDTELMQQTVAVKDSVPAGEKIIPITLVDSYGNRHHGSAELTVQAKSAAGGKLDFDFDESRIYFVLTDRFADGDETNNFNVNKNHLEAYHGGDFQGLIDKLDYIEDLGVNTLWITPIVDNIDFNKGTDFGGEQYGYHGYWAKDFAKLDEHLGDLDTFKQLIDEAHDRGIKIMVDVVLNHTGYGMKPGDQYPGVTQADKDRFAGMLRTDGLSADTDAIKGELAGLPDFLTENPDVRSQVIRWQTDWLERAKSDRGDTIDYFRVDTVKHVEDTTWKAFKNELTRIDPNFKLIGEYFGATVDSDGGTLQSGQMDSLLDFGFKGQAKAFVEGNVEAADAYLAERAAKLDNTRVMGQFLSSHDEDGFLSEYVGGDKAKLMAAAAMQITAKGQPVVYYGEELGRSGKNARDMGKGEFSENRGDMPWDKLESESKLLAHYQKLLGIRADYSKVYAKGERVSLEASNEKGYMAFLNRYEGEQLVTALGVKTAAQEVTLAVPFAAGSSVKDLYGGKTYAVSADGKVTFSLPAMADGGTVVLASVKTTPTPTPATPTPTPATPTPTPENPTPTPATPTPTPENPTPTPATPTPTPATPTPTPENPTPTPATPTPTPENPSPTPENPSPTPGNPSTPSPVTPTPTPSASPAKPENVVELTADALKASASITLEAGIAELRLPLDASTILGSKPLELKREGLTVQLPSALLAQLAKLMPAGESEGAYLRFQAAELDAAAAAAAADQAATKLDAEVKLGSKLVELSLAVVTKAGQAYSLDRFEAPVQLTFALDSGVSLQLAGIYYLSGEQPEYVGGKPSDGRLTASVSHFSRYAALEVDKTFADLSGHWAEAAVKRLSAKQIVAGTSSTTFTPAKAVTRAEFAAMLARALRLDAPAAGSAFNDVPSGAWYASAVEAARHHGIVSGKGDGTFQPHAAITREEMALMLVRAYRAQAADAAAAAQAAAVRDLDRVSAWAAKDVQDALALGLLKGRADGSFAPAASASRADSAQAILNLADRLGL